METALLFEHLVSAHVYDCQGIGASWYNACLSETNTYNNGVKIGFIYAFVKIATHNLSLTLSSEKQKFVNELFDKIPATPTFRDIDAFLLQLNQNRILF